MFGKNVWRKMFIGMVSVFIIALAAAIAVAGGTGEPPQPPPGQEKSQQVAPAAVTEITMSAVFPHDPTTGILIGNPYNPDDWPAVVSLTATGQCQGTAVSFGPGTQDAILPSYKDASGNPIQITIGTLTADLLQKYFFLGPENQATVACYPPGTVSYAAPTAVMDFQRYINVPADSGIPNMIVTAKVIWMGVSFK